MKTTKGRTVAPKRGRVIQIFYKYPLPGRESALLGVRTATSLKQGLLDYYEEHLKPQGFVKPQVTGNVLTVTRRGRKSVTYIGKDVS